MHKDTCNTVHASGLRLLWTNDSPPVDIGMFVPPAYFRGVSAAVRQPLILPPFWGPSHSSPDIVLSSDDVTLRPGRYIHTYIHTCFRQQHDEMHVKVVRTCCLVDIVCVLNGNAFPPKFSIKKLVLTPRKANQPPTFFFCCPPSTVSPMDCDMPYSREELDLPDKLPDIDFW